MSDYRRWRVAGGDVFLTLTTYRRQPILTSELARGVLRSSIESVRRRLPFDLLASVLLPDHWHLVMRLQRDDADYSTRIKWIKRDFTDASLSKGLPEQMVTNSQKQRHERGVWQPRFWEHSIRDDEDMERCLDYIHWNPRKHQLVSRVRDWPWSSFHRYVATGAYPIDWGGTAPEGNDLDLSWGEP